MILLTFPMIFSFRFSLFGGIKLFCMIWVLYRVWSVDDHLDQTKQVLWTLGAVFFSLISAIIYYIIYVHDGERYDYR